MPEIFMDHLALYKDSKSSPWYGAMIVTHDRLYSARVNT